MAHPTPYSVRLADEIARQLGQLTNDFSHLPADQAMQVLARVLDPEEGILGRFTSLVSTGSVHAKDHAERGLLPAEVWLALGRAANELDSLGFDLEPTLSTLQRFSTRPAATTAKPPAPAPLVVRRRR
ncbi:hypothetical protein ACIQU3_19010 [Streptomyces sp. NPDC101110]|uniref:hypothetical protein n=1 Tax=Streptomyces sp. NPDC101110 TaxID=3366104 RepID=UPI00380196E3